MRLHIKHSCINFGGQVGSLFSLNVESQASSLKVHVLTAGCRKSHSDNMATGSTTVLWQLLEGCYALLWSHTGNRTLNSKRMVARALIQTGASSITFGALAMCKQQEIESLKPRKFSKISCVCYTRNIMIMGFSLVHQNRFPSQTLPYSAPERVLRQCIVPSELYFRMQPPTQKSTLQSKTSVRSEHSYNSVYTCNFRICTGGWGGGDVLDFT